MAKKTDKKPVKKPAKKQPTQKQSQMQSVIINLGESKKKVRVRRKKESSEKKGLGISNRGITLHTANYAPPPTYNKFEPQRYISEKLPLSFYETNRPMNMGFNFQYPTVVPIATQTERELVPTLENQLDDNLEIVNNDSSDLPREQETPSRRGRPRGIDVNIQELKQIAKDTLDALGIRYSKRESLAKLQQKVRDAMREQIPFNKTL